MKQFQFILLLVLNVLVFYATGLLSRSASAATAPALSFDQDPYAYCAHWFGLQESKFHTAMQVRSRYRNVCENWRVKQLPVKTTQRTFEQITGGSNFRLRGDYGTVRIDFGNRRDFIITKATLNLRYSYSPALLARQSHVKVYLNEEVIGLLNINPTQAGKVLRQTLEINALSLSDYNNLKFELIGHYTKQCENPDHSSIWFEISKHSTLSLSQQPLNYQNNLQHFPEPFFDKRDATALNVPFIFASKPNKSSLRSAGILASWFGAQSKWRGADFPVLLNQLTAQHAIIFATNDEKPDFLAEHPPVEKPTLEMVSHPIYRSVKLLLVLGKDHRQLEQAVQGLVLGQQLLSGKVLTIEKIERPRLRQANDAPNWVKTDRAMKFIELVDDPQILQVQGFLPAAIRLNMRVPADLFTWRSRGIPIDLKYRYTPPEKGDDSRLNISINEKFIESFNLLERGQGGRKKRVRVPLLSEGLFGSGNRMFIPAFQLGVNNQMQLKFSFAKHRKGECETSPLYNVRAAIDPDSSIDFSGFPHYTVMPNLSHFANAGFPFTRMADLNETTVILPKKYNAIILQSLFNLMARMGVSTGYPALAYQLAFPDEKDLMQDKDLLVIGQIPLVVQQDHKDPLAHLIDASRRTLLQAKSPTSAHFDQAGYNAEPDPGIDAEIEMVSNGAIASLLGFESPYSKQRSVVVLMADQDKHLLHITDALRQSDQLSQIFGNIVIFRDQLIDSHRVGASYYLGELPFYTWIWYHLSSNPFLLALIAVISILAISLVVWRTLNDIRNRRLSEGDP